MRQTAMRRRDRKSRRLYGNIRTGCDESGDGYCHGLYGFRSDRSDHGVTSSVPLLGRDSFQEIDIAGITMPITKHNFIVKDVTKLADTIRWAFRIAQKGRPGPVLDRYHQGCHGGN